jgi:protein-tyrosine phosphatase
MHPMLEQGLRQRIFWITRRIAIGQFVTVERAKWLLEQGVTHILNVSDGSSVVVASEIGFREIVDVPIEDLDQIPDQSATRCLRIIHDVMLRPDTKLYVHCTAGQYRSPILWLYLLACGISEEEAKQLIGKRSPDSVPGHGKLISDHLVDVVRRYGDTAFLPLKDASFLEPAY